MMPSPDKTKLAWFGSLTLLLSYFEMLFPQVFPFLKLGLSNSVLLCALNISFPDFLILCCLKTFAVSIMAGTLFTPFFLLSAAQCLASGIVMYFLYRLLFNNDESKLISITGISITGAAVSTAVQIFLASLYIGHNTLKLLGPLLLFSILSGFVTSFVSLKLKTLKMPENFNKAVLQPQKSTTSVINILLPAAAVAVCIITFISDNILLSGFLLAAGFILQSIRGRKIKLLPHLFLWIFVITLSIVFPSEGIFIDLKSAVSKALKLSTAMTFSQSACTIKPTGNSLLSMTLRCYSAMNTKDLLKDLNLFRRNS